MATIMTDAQRTKYRELVGQLSQLFLESPDQDQTLEEQLEQFQDDVCDDLALLIGKATHCACGARSTHDHDGGHPCCGSSMCCSTRNI